MSHQQLKKVTQRTVFCIMADVKRVKGNEQPKERKEAAASNDNFLGIIPDHHTP